MWYTQYLIQVSPNPQAVLVNYTHSTNSAKVWLQLFIQWWVDYSSNYDKVCLWLKGAESRLEQLVVSEENMQSPPVSQVELLQDAKVDV